MRRTESKRLESGFTIIELLVVIGIMLGVMAMGSMAMGDFFSQGSFRLGVRATVNGIRAARQTAIGQRCWVLLKFVDTATDSDATNDNFPDYIEIYKEESETDESGTMVWKLPVGVDPVEKVSLPRNIEFELIPAPSGGDPDLIDRNLDDIQGIEFFPNGSCRPLDDDTNVIKLLDAMSRDHASIYIYTVTGFIKVRYMWRE